MDCLWFGDADATCGRRVVTRRVGSRLSGKGPHILPVRGAHGVWKYVWGLRKAYEWMAEKFVWLLFFFFFLFFFPMSIIGRLKQGIDMYQRPNSRTYRCFKWALIGKWKRSLPDTRYTLFSHLFCIYMYIYIYRLWWWWWWWLYCSLCVEWCCYDLSFEDNLIVICILDIVASVKKRVNEGHEICLYM